MTHHSEPARSTPIAAQTDVLLCGGGPAGVAAALAAARTGAAVTLIESQGCLGGIWTVGLLSWILDAKNKSGIMPELLQRLDARAGRGHHPGDGGGGVAYDVEQMKIVLETMCLEAGIAIRLHTAVVAAARDERNRLAVAITESKSGREAWSAKVFIDATGDGDLAARAGCGFDFGRPATGPGSEGPDRVGETQPMTMMCLVTGIDPDATAAFHRRGDGRPWAAPKDALAVEFQRAGVTASYGKPTIFMMRPDLYAWMINHEYSYSGLDAGQLTQATLHARAELHRNIDALRSLGDPWRDLRIIATPQHIGVREGRRIHGRYTVSLDDMLAGIRHDDAVCRVTFGIDVHSTSKSHTTGIEESPGKGKTQPYDVPLRALLARDVDGLLLAGRCISGDFLAHSSYRVTGNSVAMGQAAGVTAGLAAQRDRPPHEIPFADVAPHLGA